MTLEREADSRLPARGAQAFGKTSASSDAVDKNCFKISHEEADCLSEGNGKNHHSRWLWAVIGRWQCSFSSAFWGITFPGRNV